MKRDRSKPPTIDQIAAHIRDQVVDPETVELAARRVERRLANTDASDPSADTGDAIRGCADFQTLIPAYLTGSLTEARRLLVEDHTRACIPCRRALTAARNGHAAPRSGAAGPNTVRAHRSWPVALAASVALAAALGSLWLVRELRPISGTVARVQSVDGTLYRALDAAGSPLAPGTPLEAGETVRTSKGAGAMLELEDGSLVELAERTEIAVRARRSGTVIDLGRGNVIIQAAKQHDGHLYVQTRDCLVSVTGTTFAVSHGTKGSRVSVIEGRVEVDDGRQAQVLGAGDQVSTSPNLDRVPVAEDIAWSRHLDQHLQLLEEFADLGREIQATVLAPPPRATSRLLDRLPADTVVYAAVPNLSRSLSDAYELFRQRVASSQVLADWWQEAERSGADSELEEAMARIRELGAYLGDEVVFTLQMDKDGEPGAPLILAEVADAAGLRAFLDDELTRLAPGHGAPFVLVDDPTALPADAGPGDVPLVWVRDDVAAVATRPAELLALMRSDDGEFARSPFHERIAETYSGSVSWVFAIDAASLWSRRFGGAELSTERQRQRDAYRRMGLLDLRHVIFDQRTDTGGLNHRQALLTFDQPRRGVAAWLAPPAPMASLEFLSPEASLAGAFVVKNPAAMLDDLLAALETLDPGVEQRLHDFELEQGLRVREDIAAPLGGELAFAIDGPILPKPAWKLVVEVYQPEVLEHTFEWMVERANDQLVAHGRPPLVLDHEVRDGRTFHTLHTTPPAPDVHYVFVDGYLLAAPDRALLDRAIRYRDSGHNLASSPRFTALFPADGYSNFSAVVYHDLASLVAPLAGHLASAGDLQLSPAQQAALARIAADAAPELLYGYADTDQILFAGTTHGGILGMDLSTLISLHGLLGVEQAMKQAGGGEGAR